MARTFCLTTEGWSRYWLNDVTQSRRPWLHRKPNWREIDEVLQSLAPLTFYHDRKHSEEYAAACASLKAELSPPGSFRVKTSASLPDMSVLLRDTIPDTIRFHGYT